MRFCLGPGLAVDFDQYRVINILAEGAFDGLQIGAVAIACDLDAVAYPLQRLAPVPSLYRL